MPKRKEQPRKPAATPKSKAAKTVSGAEEDPPLHGQFMNAAVKAAVTQAECLADRFVHGKDVRYRKCGFFRELDRHTMYYVRARRALLRRMRGLGSDLPADHDLGRLSQKEAEAVVMASVIFRLYNRMDAFVRWHVMGKYVKDPRTASVAAWRAALGKLDASDVAEIKRAERTLADDVTPAAAIAAAVAPDQVLGFLNFVDACFGAKGSSPGDAKMIKLFTGQHQVQGRERTREAVEAVFKDLGALTRDLRAASGAQEACTRLGQYPCFGPFVQYQVYLDLIEPRHSIFRGWPNEEAIERDRLEFAQFGPGSRGGAQLISTGKRGDGYSQAKSLRVAYAFCSFAAHICGEMEVKAPANAELTERWRKATAELFPLPAGLAGGAGTRRMWDMQSVENQLCGIHNKKTPDAIVASAQGIKPNWTPNPCTTLEYKELYGGGVKVE